jgi:hypothetical protein
LPAVEVHVFLLWSEALDKADDILADIGSHFTIREIWRVTWSREHFAQNLTRFYGQALLAGSEKELHCGVGPFLVVVVEDRQPTYARRRTTRGRLNVNTRMFDAKARYRRWTGRGHRVHATVNRREADKDLFLLLGRRAMFYESASNDQWNGTIIEEHRDLIGASGWQSRSELLTALETSIGYVALAEACAPETAFADETPTLLVENIWWAARIANGRGERDQEQRVPVEGREQRVSLAEVGDGSLDPVWQRALMSHSIRDAEGVMVPRAIDRFYLTLLSVASEHRELSASEEDLLERIARHNSLERGDYGDRNFATAAVQKYLAQLRESDDRRNASELTPLASVMRRLSRRGS